MKLQSSSTSSSVARKACRFLITSGCLITSAILPADVANAQSPNGPGSVEVIYAGTPGTQGTPLLSTPSDPIAGSDFVIALSGMAPQSWGVLVSSSSSTPTRLSQFQATMYPTAPFNLSVPFFTGNKGEMQFVVPGQITSQLAGKTAVMQMAVLDQSASGGIAFSNALCIVFGAFVTDTIKRAELPRDTAIGDVDGDGFADIVQYADNRIFAARNTFQREGILNTYLDVPIKRLILGDFTTAGREHGRAQVVAITEDNALRVFSSSNDNRTLWWWFTQGSFIGDEEEVLVGDFDGDSADDLLVYDPSLGTLRLYARNQPSDVFFHLVKNFTLGNLASYNLVNKHIYVGDFGQEKGRSDLLIVDPNSGQVSRYDSVTSAGNVTFWWAFHSRVGMVRNGEYVAVGNIDGGVRDSVLIAGPTHYSFYRAEFDGGILQPITEVSVGNLANHPRGLPFMDRLAGWDGEPGRARDDIMLYKVENGQFAQFDARFDPARNQLTYWWAYTSGRPRYNEGWPGIRYDRWLVLKSKFNDVGAEPFTDQYFDEFFTNRHNGKWGMFRYLHELSYGTVVPRIELPSTWANVPHSLADGMGVDRGVLNSWARAAAGANLDDYFGVVSIYNAGGVKIGAAGKIVNLHTDFLNQNVVGHEMLHVYGLRHSFDDSTRKLASWAAPGEYYDPYDVEGSSPPTARFTGDFGSSGPGLHAVNKEILGWLPAQRVHRLAGGFTSPTEVRLAALNRPECNGALSLIINLPGGNDLAVELREARDWDQGFGRDAVYVRLQAKHPTKSYDVTYLRTTGAGPQFIVGEQFMGYGITIDVLSIDSTNGTATIRVRRS